jgi:two-component system, NtrC family, sensor histidine kinase PilS
VEDRAPPARRDAVNAPALNRLLRAFAWARLGLAQVLLVVTPAIPADLIPGMKTGILALALVAVALSSGALLLLGPPARPRRVAWLLCLLDVVLVTAVVAATGEARSIFPFLYVLTVTAACVLLSRWGAVAIAGAASGLHAALVFSGSIVPTTALFEPPRHTTGLEVLTVFLNAATFLIVAVVAGGLAEQFRTSQRELEAQRKDLADLQAFKELILRSVGAGLIALDRQHTVTALNRAAEEITGCPAPAAIGRPWPALFGSSAPLETIEAAIDGNPHTSPRHEMTVERADGTRIPVRLTFSALRSDEGARLGLIAVCENLSEMRDMEARMRQADRLATLGRMAANIAHEIRNPLASLTGAIEVLTGDAGAEGDRERLHQIVHGESERLNRIIRNFLEYARPAPLAFERLDVAELLEEVLVLLEHRDLPPALKLVRGLPSSLPWRVDPQQFRQALWNLVLNAVEAMPDGGELRVAAAIHRGRLEISVGDTGGGIDPDDLPHVFEPFFSTKPGGSSGLGLALVHRIVRDHGGDVEVRSGAGFGTTFVLTLPAMVHG